MIYQPIDQITVIMSWATAASHSHSNGKFDASTNIDVECEFALKYTRDIGIPQPLCSQCHNNITSHGITDAVTLCPKCKWQEKTGLPGVNFTHTPLGGKTIPLSSASLASKPGSLSSEERKEWQGTIKAELTKPRFKTGDPVVPIDHVGWGRLIKKEDDEIYSIASPSHGKELSERMFGQYLGGFWGIVEEEFVFAGERFRVTVEDDSESDGFLLVTLEGLDNYD